MTSHLLKSSKELLTYLLTYLIHKWSADLELQVNVFRHFLTVRLQQFDHFLERLKHLISCSLSVFDGHHVTHNLHETRVITFFDRLIKSSIRRLNKVIQVF